MKCRCGKQAVFHRQYEGRHLCRDCFRDSIEKKIKRTIRKNGMIEKGDRIAVALSNPQSLLVLRILQGIAGPRNDLQVFCISVDWAGQVPVENHCKGNDHVRASLRGEFGREMPLKAEDECTAISLAKRWILNKQARLHGATKLATGHTLDDEAESVLLNYMRGDIIRASRSGPRPLKKHRLFIPRIKPLREVPESEALLYLELEGIRTRPRTHECQGMRDEARRFIREMESRHPGITFSLVETFDKVLSGMESRKKPVICSVCGEPSSDSPCQTCRIWRGA